MSKKARKQRAKSVMHTDIKDLEVTRKLRDLANIQVTEWELSDVIPAVKELANKEVDVAGFFRRTANYRIIEWELPGRAGTSHASDWEGLSAEAASCVRGISMFLQFVARELVIHPGCVKVEVFRRRPADFRFQLVLPREDAAALIGHGGHTAAALRHLMEAAGARFALSIDLKILTHEEHQARTQTEAPLVIPTRAKPPTRNIGHPRKKKSMESNTRKKRIREKEWDREDG